MNYKIKFLLFFIVFITVFSVVRILGVDIYKEAHHDLAGIGWLFSIIGLIFSILSGFLIQHLWDKWERIQKVVLEEINALDHLLMFSASHSDTQEKTYTLIKEYIGHVIGYEWTSKVKLTEASGAVLALKDFNEEYVASAHSQQDKTTQTKLINTLLYVRDRRILLATRRMPYIIKNTFLLSTILVIVLSLFVAIESIPLDFLFTISIASLVFAIYLIVDDMDNVLSPGAWHISSKLYKEFLKKLD